ncbi:hypothetical protein Y88_2381 [Novosphingobium nitrogenifigens DSM 19370]|uniref:Polyhydroxyalkanoic acid system protein n=1 Tax=Novosphingobium nitrogenifigens DSM 19370 TaxID=983920 RepID=F1Z6F9_9SPHN|nr:polyhydroxyalkanoic acid system family protein [Novosphingobium nitrogenifigens]EGD59941.1 hypothetical protein Y88_2381 [Novosphingobium nitrogenifigens DSM 19370]
MRIEIPHSLAKDEIRRRIDGKMDKAEAKAGALIGGPLTLAMTWVDEDNLAVEAAAMGYTVPCTLEIAEAMLIFEVEIPSGLGFARGMIGNMIRDRGERLIG